LWLMPVRREPADMEHTFSTEEIEQYQYVPVNSAQAYRDRMFFLLEEVNRVMDARDDLDRLIGNNPRSRMYDNHRNHAAFMATVFALNNYGMLLSVVPWVYRAYASQGFSYDYFPVHLRAWQKVLEENLPPDDAAPLKGIYGRLIASHETFIALSRETTFLEIPAGNSRREEATVRFLEAVLRGDSATSLTISSEQVAGAADLEDFYQWVVRPTMYRVGEMWERGEISVAKEHLASAVVNRILAAHYLDFVMKSDPTRGTVIVAASANEFHEIGARMVASAFELDGWNVEFLGADTPVEDLLEMVAEKRPFVLAVSATMPFNIEHVSRIIERVRALPVWVRPKIMIGGLAFRHLSDPSGLLGANGYAGDCAQAVDLVRKWSGEVIE